MASLRTKTLKDGTTTYTVLFRAKDEHGVKRQTSETFDREKDAADFMASIERHGPEMARHILDARDGAGSDVLTVAELVARHIDALSGITEGTRKRYRYIQGTIAKHSLGALPITGVRRTDVAAWVRDLEDSGLSGKTISLRHQLLAAAFKRAVGDDLLVKSPATGVKMPRTERRAKVYLSKAEFMKVYAVVPDEWRALVHTLAGTGMRISEALALRVGDLHLDGEHPRIDVQRTWQWTEGGPARTGAPKTERGRRSVSIGPALVQHLREHTEGMAADAWVFTRDGEPIDRNVVGHQWRKWVRQAGITKKPRLHDLRHTHVSWMLHDRQTLDRIRDRLGHASIKVTVDVYGSILPDALDEMAAASDRALAGLLEA
jgi:integrase